MQGKPSHKFVLGQCHGFDCCPLFVILIAKCDRSFTDCKDFMVGDDGLWYLPE